MYWQIFINFVTVNKVKKIKDYLKSFVKHGPQVFSSYFSQYLYHTGLNIFFPSITERATFLGEIILQHSLSVQDLPLFVTTLLEKISCEPNASLLIFPVCPDELPNADSLSSMDTAESPENNVLLRVILQSLGNRATEHIANAAKATETSVPLPQLYPTQDLLLKFAFAFQKDLSRRALQCITSGNSHASPCK